MSGYIFSYDNDKPRTHVDDNTSYSSRRRNRNPRHMTDGPLIELLIRSPLKYRALRLFPETREQRFVSKYPQNQREHQGPP